MDEICLTPVGIVHNLRRTATDDDWGAVESEIELVLALPEHALDGLEEFSHVEVIFAFHLVGAEEVTVGVRRPRGNPKWPPVGIFAQRGKNRPNRIGATIAAVVERHGRVLRVRGLDAIDGTPVLDIKPVFAEFLPAEPVRQPAWVAELMANYWNPAPPAC